MTREVVPLTGLRGLAALLVVISHYPAWCRVTPPDAVPAGLVRWTSTADIGMAIFFTLSGFVIALSYNQWDWRARPVFNCCRLALYRFARLYPAYLVFAAFIVLRHTDLQRWNPDYLLPHLALMQAWLPVKYGGAIAAHGHFHVSWSISVECALYLGFALFAIWRWLGPVFLIASAAFGVGCWFLKSLLAPDWSDAEWVLWANLESPYAVAFQFAIGVVAWRVSRDFPVAWSTAASNAGGLALLGIYLTDLPHHPFGHIVGGPLVALATSLVMVGANSASTTNRLLSGRAIVYIGTISYSLYLFHFLTPPLALHGRFYAEYTATAAAFHAINILASLGIAIIVATGIYVLVEKPGRAWIRHWGDRLLKAATVSAAGTPPFAAATQSAGEDQRR